MLEEVRTLQTPRILRDVGHLGPLSQQFADRELVDFCPILLVVDSARPHSVVLKELILNEFLLLYTGA